jgi:hypothetical protein
MRRSRIGFAGAALIALVIGAMLPAAGSGRTQATGLASVQHVFVIVLENEDEGVTFGSGSKAPYLANTLTAQGAFVPNYYGIGHHSLDNYIAMISGQAPNANTQNDCQTFSDFTATGPLNADGQLPGGGCIYPTSVPTIASQLDGAGLTWRGYMDGMGADPTRESVTCGHPTIGTADKTQGATATDQYATRHDPFMYFHGVIDNQSYCDSHVVALPKLASDLGSVATTPNLSYITPNLCNDGHDSPCADGGPGGLTQANTFLQTVVPEIEASAAFKKDGLIVITFDESDSDDSTACCNEQPGPNAAQPGGTGAGGGKTGAVLLSPFIPAGTTTSTAYNHYSLLRSMEDAFGLSHLAFAAQSGLSSFGSDIFGASPGPTTSTTTSGSSTTGSTTTTTKTTTTTTTTSKPKPKPKPVRCVAAKLGPALGTSAVVKTKTGRSLTATIKRSGILEYQVRPAHGVAHKAVQRKLTACGRFSLALPSGHGSVTLRTTVGKRHDSRTVKY